MVDLILCALWVAMVHVNPAHAKVDGVKPKAEFLIQMTYPVDRDVDLDLWLAGPSRNPVFYNSRQSGCADLDRDSLGLSTSTVELADGSKVKMHEDVETISIRCIEPGHNDVAVNLFSWRDDKGAPITAHVEVTALNPNVRTVWAGDITLKHLGETINTVSFDLSPDGKVALVSVPLEPLTSAYEKAKAGAAP